MLMCHSTNSLCVNYRYFFAQRPLFTELCLFCAEWKGGRLRWWRCKCGQWEVVWPQAGTVINICSHFKVNYLAIHSKSFNLRDICQALRGKHAEIFWCSAIKLNVAFWISVISLADSMFANQGKKTFSCLLFTKNKEQGWRCTSLGWAGDVMRHIFLVSYEN